VVAKALPTPASIGDLVTMLVGKSARAGRGTPLAASAARGVATYIDKDAKVIFVTLTDIAFLASVGAALAMIPPGVAGEAVKSGKPSAVLVENAVEVLNILASLFNDADGKGTHVKLQRLLLMPPLPPELARLVAKPTQRLDLEVTLPGYPNGKLSLLAVT
jgi:hypothetical protein